MRKQVGLLLASFLVVLGAHAQQLSKEEQLLRNAIEFQDRERLKTAMQYLDKDAAIDGNAYKQYDAERRARQSKMSISELELELKAMEVNKAERAAKIAEAVLGAPVIVESLVEPSSTAEAPSRSIIIEPTPVHQSASVGQTASPTVTPSLSSPFSSVVRDYVHANGGWDRTASDDTPDNDDLVDYVVDMPGFVTGGEPKSIKVKAKRSKMDLIKQKQALDKMLIDDVLGMTGRLPK